jgi:hypothetical protein
VIGAQSADGLAPVPDGRDGVAALLEDAGRDLTVHRVVLGEQDAQARRGRGGARGAIGRAGRRGARRLARVDGGDDPVEKVRLLDGLGQRARDAQLAAARGIARTPADVRRRIGTSRRVGSAFTDSASMKPSIPGICPSVTTS